MLLKLAPEYANLVLNGRKRSTIRAGNRVLDVGPAELLSGERRIAISVDRLRFTTFGSLNDEDAKLDGFENLEELREALFRFYPHLEAQSPVTVVHFSLRD